MKKFLNHFVVVKGSDRFINFATISLSLLGLVMVVSASMQASDNSTRVLIITTIKQVLYFTISYGLMFFLSKIFSYKLARHTIMPISLIMIGLLLSTLFFKELNGSYAWIRIGSGSAQFTIQPSEFAKVTSIVLIAMYLGDVSYKTPRNGIEIIKPIFYMILIQAFIITFLQKDFGSAIVLLMISLFIAFIPSHPRIRKYQNILMFVTFLGIFFAGFILSDTGIALIEKTGILKGYKLARFTAYANPFVDIQDTGFQLANSLVSFSRGGLFGVGLGQSVQKYGYLPEATTDFILPLIAEELGFVGIIVIFSIYIGLIYRLTYHALKVKEEKGKMILMGTALYLFIHFFLNVGGVSLAIPLTGVPLLLLSSGGSSSMAIFSAIGICQKIISDNRKMIDNENS